MDTKSLTIITCIGLVSIGAVAWFAWPSSTKEANWKLKDLRSSEAKEATTSRQEADSFYAKADYKNAEQAYVSLIENNGSSADKNTQDEVGLARIRLGYIAAKQKDFTKARTWFQQASKEYQGTGERDPDYGGIDDQAAYQAAVCLNAAGKKTEAEEAFIAFLVERKSSPLIHAAFSRLKRLNGKTKPQYEALLQAAVSFQELQIRQDLASCGPRAIEHLLKLVGKPTPLATIEKLCDAGTDGATMDSIKYTLKTLGIPTFGYRLNRQDFLALALPAILLQQKHYVVLTAISAENITFYDPIFKSERTSSLPSFDDKQFTADVLTLQPIQLKETNP